MQPLLHRKSAITHIEKRHRMVVSGEWLSLWEVGDIVFKGVTQVGDLENARIGTGPVCTDIYIYEFAPCVYHRKEHKRVVALIVEIVRSGVGTGLNGHMFSSVAPTVLWKLHELPNPAATSFHSCEVDGHTITSLINSWITALHVSGTTFEMLLAPVRKLRAILL